MSPEPTVLQSRDPVGAPAIAIADAVVVAAGSSRRMNGLDKVEAEVGGRPLLAWTLDRLAAANAVERIVVVAVEARVEELRSRPWLPAKVAGIVPGGPRRQESVARGVRRLQDLDAGRNETDPSRRVVLVHDAARPLASADLANRVAHAAARHGAAIPVVPVAETLKRIDGDLVVETVDRTGLAGAQTPQGFRRDLLEAAYAQVPVDGPTTWTDEAALLEICRMPVHALPGEPTNLKVTLPGDLARVESALLDRAQVRVGFGNDAHAFGPGTSLILGGVEIPRAPRLHGHSDGDVALHAIADALLGAAGLGDLGRLFPAGPQTPQGIASRELLGAVVRRVSAAGYRPVSIDLTIVGSRPRLGGLLDQMRATVAEIVGIDAGQVSVKASTGNLSGTEGAGRGIAAQAVALLEVAR